MINGICSLAPIDRSDWECSGFRTAVAFTQFFLSSPDSTLAIRSGLL
jgi:hypothetical protein